MQPPAFLAARADFAARQQPPYLSRPHAQAIHCFLDVAVHG